MLILDLDDTIFETKSMNPEVFDLSISVITNYCKRERPEVDLKKMIEALWEKPIDVVIADYQIPNNIVENFYTEIGRIDHSRLKIKTFEDYKEIKLIPKRKVLVTTGLKELQLSKIKALNIVSDFESIFIDDPRTQPRNYKLAIFKKILIEENLKPEEVWVIGDNPESEIKAGNKLGMRTIQRKSTTKKISDSAEFKIESFRELKEIIK